MASSSRQTYYEVLGIDQQAELKDIRDAYRKLALRCHPDKDPSNPRAVATFQKLGMAYETLSDGIRRKKYDAALISSQKTKQWPRPAWPTPTSTWGWSSDAREKANQARREDAEYWSGPTYFHGWHPEQEDEDSSKHQEGQRAARKEARREAKRKKRDMDRPPPWDSVDQDPEASKAKTAKCNEERESWEKTKKKKRDDDGSEAKSPSPQQPDPNRSEKVEEKKEKKEQSARRKAERELSARDWPAELLILFSEIMALQVDIEKTRDKVDASMNNDRHGEDHEQIFELPIKQKFLERCLQQYLDKYKRIVKLLRDRGSEQEANEAYVKLREVRKAAARHERLRRKETEQVYSTTESQTRRKSEHDQKQPPTSNQGCMPDQPCIAKYVNTKSSPKTTLPIYDGHNDEDETLQQHYYHEDRASLRVNYDGSDPDRGFTEDTPEPSVTGEEDDCGHGDWDMPLYSVPHGSHMEVHGEFWDIVDSEHECNFCRHICTVMQCPSCKVQACAYCKDAYRSGE